MLWQDHKISTHAIKEAKHMHYKKQIQESDHKVKPIWKILKDKTHKHSTVEENPSIKVNNNVINSAKLTANSFSTYFLIIVEN
jgi:hypothetical protein